MIEAASLADAANAHQSSVVIVGVAVLSLQLMVAQPGL
jgi:hypothetical protein